MTRKTINTSRTDVHCDVCGRTLLRGENSETYIDGGTRRAVCDLCTARAQHEGWVREDDLERVSERQVSGDRRRSLFGRLRSRRETRPGPPSTGYDAYPADGGYQPDLPYGRPPGMRKVERIERVTDDPADEGPLPADTDYGPPVDERYDQPADAGYAPAPQPQYDPEPQRYEPADRQPADEDDLDPIEEARPGDPAAGRAGAQEWGAPAAEEYDVDQEYPDEPGYAAAEPYPPEPGYPAGQGERYPAQAGYAEEPPYAGDAEVTEYEIVEEVVEEEVELEPPAARPDPGGDRGYDAPAAADEPYAEDEYDDDYDDDELEPADEPAAGLPADESPPPENGHGPGGQPQPVQAETARRGADRDPRAQRQVHAVPMTAGMKMQRALSAFNSSEHVRTVGGIARTLGAPIVAVKPSATRGSVVGIVVAWELSWYRFEVELADEVEPVTVVDRGDELEELPEEDRVANALVHEDGALELASGP